MPAVCEIGREDGTRSRILLKNSRGTQVADVPAGAPIRLVRLDPDHRLPLFDPDNKSFHGRPWIVLQIDGRKLRIRNEAPEKHRVWLSIGRGSKQRTQTSQLGPGSEITVDLPDPGAPIAAYDLTDHLKLDVD